MNQIATPDLYLKTCDRLSKNGCDARIYQTSELALYDIIHSLIHYMPHKNKIAVVSQGSHLIETVTSIALKNQNQILYKKLHENIVSFLETLDSHTHFIFWSAEHEVTGEILYSQAQQDEIINLANRKKIFSVQLTYNSATVMTFMPDTVSYSIVLLVPEIFKSSMENSIVYFSEKQKIPFGLALLQNNIFLDQLLPSGKINERVVIHLEASSALAIKEMLKLRPQDAFVAADYPFWTTEKWSMWWPEVTQPHFLERLLVLSAEYRSSNKDYLHQINQAEKKIKELSSWKI